MRIESVSFQNNTKIPSEFTCDGVNISPEMHILDAPKHAKSLSLIMDDPDAIPIAGFVWDHWVTWNIPADTKIIQKGKEPKGVSGTTSFKRKGYGGPCPPSGTHKYFFKLYALDKMLDLKEGSTKKELELAMNDHIIEKAELIGLYSRKTEINL